jgi:hypothetical protein
MYQLSDAYTTMVGISLFFVTAMTFWNLRTLRKDKIAFLHFVFSIIGYIALLVIILAGGTFSDSAILNPAHQNLLKISLIPIIYIVLYVSFASRGRMDFRDSGDLLSVIDFTILAAFTHQCIVAGSITKDFSTVLYLFPWFFIFDDFFRRKNSRTAKRWSKVAFSLFAMCATLSLEQRGWTNSWFELYRVDAEMTLYWIVLFGSVLLAWFLAFMTHTLNEISPEEE